MATIQYDVRTKVDPQLVITLPNASKCLVPYIAPKTMLVGADREHGKGCFELLETVEMLPSYGIDLHAIGVADNVDSRQAISLG